MTTNGTATPQRVLRRFGTLVVLLVALLGSLAHQSHAVEVPRSVEALWADFDPRQEPLAGQVVRDWTTDGIQYRYVTFHIATFKGQPARMAAFYAFPQGGTKLPGLLHMHGGGQRAFLHEVTFYAKQGYACLSVNWGGREMEEAKPGDANTAWGAVDPTQQNVPGYLNLQPGDKYLEAHESPRNNNWYLLTLGCRRGLTFLEQQAEVDPDRLGIYGHSMGGNLTVYVAGTDARVKAAAPSVGGSGFRTDAWPLLPQERKQMPNGDVSLFKATIGFESYAPRIKAPLLWLGSTNDFHGIMDDTYRTGQLIPHEQVRYSFAPHLNHRFTPEFAVTRSLWFEQHLKQQFSFPTTPRSTLVLDNSDGIPRLTVSADLSQPIAQVQVYYSVDPQPQARFWRAAETKPSDKTWMAELPILSVDQPLFAFANVEYQLDKPRPVPFDEPTKTFSLSSEFQTATPDALRKANVRATDAASLLIDDFAAGFRDWYQLSANNPHHWEYSTRKICDPKWQGQPGQQLVMDVRAEKPNELIVMITENFFRSSRGRSTEYAAVVKLTGGEDYQTVKLSPSDFHSLDGNTSLTSWQHADLLSLRAYVEKNGTLLGSKAWAGRQPQFRELRWSPQ
jgi:dienelactone hydrolase